MTKKCLKREGVSEEAAGPVAKVKRKYIRKKKSEAGWPGWSMISTIG